jgi:hypothetical protein
MAKYLVRTSCEFSTLLEAEDEAEAFSKAEKLKPEDWDNQSWSTLEIDDYAPRCVVCNSTQEHVAMTALVAGYTLRGEAVRIICCDPQEVDRG